MTLKELQEAYISVNKGLAYKMWRQANLNCLVLSKNFPKTPEEACPELYPPKKKYQMPDFLIEKARKRGVI